MRGVLRRFATLSTKLGSFVGNNDMRTFLYAGIPGVSNGTRLNNYEPESVTNQWCTHRAGQPSRQLLGYSGLAVYRDKALQRLHGRLPIELKLGPKLVDDIVRATQRCVEVGRNIQPPHSRVTIRTQSQMQSGSYSTSGSTSTDPSWCAHS